MIEKIDPKKKVRRVKNTKNIRANAKKNTEEKKTSFKGFFRVIKYTLVTSVCAFIIGVTGYYGTSLINKFLERPITSVVVQGDFEYLTRSSIELLIEEYVKRSFIKENLSAMRNSLLANPWIDNVALKREWPNVLHITIEEQRAIARWGDKGFVNHRGDLVLTKEGLFRNDLPLLRGDADEAGLLMKKYQFLSGALSEYGLTVSVLEKDRVGIWVAELSNGWKLLLGRSGVNKKIQHLLLALEQRAILLSSEVDSIDLRYENGLSVKWIESSDSSLHNEAVSIKETKKLNEQNI